MVNSRMRSLGFEMEAVAHDARARRLRCIVAPGDTAAMALATGLDARQQNVLSDYRRTRIVTAVAARHFRFVRGMREVCMRKERRRQPHRFDVPRQVGISLTTCYLVAIDASTSFKQISRGRQGLDSRFGSNAIAIGATQTLAWPPQSLLPVVGIRAKQSGTVVLHQNLYDAFGIAVRHGSRRIIGIEI